MGLVESFLNFVIGIILTILVVMLLYHVLTNGGYYGGKIGDMLGGAVEFGKSLFNHAVH